MLALILCTALAVLLILGTIMAHELGHAAMMRRHGIVVAVIALGYGPLLYRRTRSDGVEFQLRLIPLGGFARAEAAIPTQPARPFREIMGIGCVVNLCLGLAMVGLSELAPGSDWPRGLALLAMAVLVWCLRRPAARWSVTLGALLIAAFASGLAVTLSPGQALSILSVHQPRDAIAGAGFASLNLALFNALPLAPLDGGQIAVEWVGEKFGKKVEAAYGWGTLALFLVVFAGTNLGLLHL